VSAAVRELPKNGDGPLYKQLADMLLDEINKGILESNSHLPTVRDLAEEMSVSVGTVKHAYDELERLGVIEKVRGRGTYVLPRDDTLQGKKQRAMSLIDDMFAEMKELGFSLRETQIFFELKMRGLQDSQNARIVAVDCNPEALYVIADQIGQVRGSEVSSRLLEDLEHIPGVVDDESDIIVTTANHYEQVAQVAARDDKVCRVVLSPSQDTVAAIAKCESGGNIGIFTASDRFVRIIGNVCEQLLIEDSEIPHKIFGSAGVEDFLAKLSAVIVPNFYPRLCSPDDLAAIRSFEARGGAVIEFTYHIDAGSLMYLEQRIERVLENRAY